MGRLPSVSELHQNVLPHHVLARLDKNGRFNRFEIGVRTKEERREILDHYHYFHFDFFDRTDLDFRRQVCTERLKKMINVFVDYVQKNYLDAPTRGLPVFPDVFHRTISDFVYHCSYHFRMRTNVINIYDAILHCIQVFAPKTEYKYLVIPPELGDDKEFWKAPLENEILRDLTEKRFDRKFDFEK